MEALLLGIASALAVASLAATLLILVYRISNPTHKSANLPPSPPGWPLLGHLHFLGSNPHTVLHKFAKQYGPLMSLRLGAVPAIVVSSSELARDVLQTYDRCFASRRIEGVTSTLISYGQSDIVGSPYGEHWRRVRKLCILEIFSRERLQSFASFLETESLALIHNLWEESRAGQSITLNLKLATFSLNITSKILFSKTVVGWNATTSGNEASKFLTMIKEVLALAGTLNNCADYFPSLRCFDLQGYKRRMVKVLKTFDKFISGIVEERRLETTQKRHTSDIVDVLLSQSSENLCGKLGGNILSGVLLNLFVAGVDTTSITVEWAMAELILHPDIRIKVQNEIDALVGKDRLVDESDLCRLTYLQAVIKETFRLHPAAPLLIPHESLEACQLAGYDIPAKTLLLVNVWAIGRDENTWERPLDFNPDRFLNSDMDVKGQHFDLIPFGSGRRICPGLPLALILVKLVLARLIHSFDWSLPSSMTREQIDMSETLQLTCFKTKPLEIVPRPRLAPNLYGPL